MQAVFETGGIRRTFTESDKDAADQNEGSLVSLLKLDKDKVCVRTGARVLCACVCARAVASGACVECVWCGSLHVLRALFKFYDDDVSVACVPCALLAHAPRCPSAASFY